MSRDVYESDAALTMWRECAQKAEARIFEVEADLRDARATIKALVASRLDTVVPVEVGHLGFRTGELAGFHDSLIQALYPRKGCGCGGPSGKHRGTCAHLAED
jgi:hypothetical protein